MTEFTRLERRREGEVEYLSLNRPAQRNALDEALVAELTTWAERARQDSALRAVVMSGAGPVFCAGADLGHMSAMASATHEANIRDASALSAMFAALDGLPVPVIARVHGAAIGGGAGLVAVADIAVAARDAVFGFTEVTLGLLPAVIAPYVLAKIGQSPARELFLTAARFTAERAREIGLVHAVVPAGELDHAVQSYVDTILGNGREAMAAAKALIRHLATCDKDDVTQASIAAITTQRATPEAKARMKAFLERRRS